MRAFAWVICWLGLLNGCSSDAGGAANCGDHCAEAGAGSGGIDSDAGTGARGGTAGGGFGGTAGSAGAASGGAAGAASGGSAGAGATAGVAGVGGTAGASGGTAGAAGAAGSGAAGTGGTGCTAETDAAFCSRLGKDCDLVSGFDNCGTGRSVNCGTCNAPDSCGGNGVPNVCGHCDPESDAQLCASGAFDCGVLDIVDRCGKRRFPNCGSCPSATGACIVSSSCVANRCATVAEPDGTRCGVKDTVTGSDFCLKGGCVTAKGYCEPTTPSGWIIRATLSSGAGLGGFYNQAECSCPSSSQFHFKGTSVPGATPVDLSCPNSCVALGQRRACF